MHKRQKCTFLLGFIFLFMGAIGIVIPLLPTTPFIIMASVCFSNSPKMRAWLSKSKLFSDYIENYSKRTGLKRSTIIISLVFLWLTLIISAIWVRNVWACILIVCIGIAVTIHILYMSLPRKQLCKPLYPFRLFCFPIYQHSLYNIT